MPLYEYECLNCGEQFEVMQKFSDPPLTTHEKCGGEVKRLLSAPALQFKGSGWYITDYAKGGTSSKPAGDKSSSDNGSKPATGSEKGSSSSSPSSGSSTTSSSSTSDKK